MADVHSKEYAVKIWLLLKERIQSLKCSCAVFYMPMDFATSFTIKASPANLILLASTVRQVLPKYRTGTFVHACPPWRRCFWHRHESWKCYDVPETRIEWWLNKINGNLANNVKTVITKEALLFQAMYSFF